MSTCELTNALDDQVRLAALQATDLLDTPPDEEFDRLAQLATKVLKAPVALVTLVTPDRQFFKACFGLPKPWSEWRQTPLTHSFCQHVVKTCRPLVISDARTDERLKDNLAIADLGVIAYLGIPLTVSSGPCLGSFCIIDSKPREWTDSDVSTMQTLAKSVITEIELRRHRKSLMSIVEERTRLLNRELERSRLLEEQLRLALHNAAVAQGTKDRLIANLSHELRTPLTPVLLEVSVLEQSADIPEDLRKDFGYIREQIEVEAKLIDDLLTATAIQPAIFRRTKAAQDLHSILETAIKDSGEAAKARQVSMSWEWTGEKAQVAGDEALLQDAFRRIIANAIKFSRPGGKVTIRNRLAAINGTKKWSVVEIVDEGAGIEPEQLSRLFHAFEQGSTPASQSRSGGMGLGLVIAKATFESHGGYIQAHSEGKDKGATFSVWLPIAEGSVTSSDMKQ